MEELKLVDNVNVEEVAEEAVEVLEAVQGKDWKKYGLIGLGVAGGCAVAYVGYKKVVKPGVAKVKAKIAEKKASKEAENRKAMSNIHPEDDSMPS